MLLIVRLNLNTIKENKYMIVLYIYYYYIFIYINKYIIVL